MAIFAVSEYWVNYLAELRQRNIPTFLVSAYITEKAPFFRWYKPLYLKCLDSYSQIMVLDEESRKKLRSVGMENVSLAGDPLFDRAMQVRDTSWSDPIVQRFASDRNVFIAGSISDRKDLELVSALANACRDVRFILVPHEISEETLCAVRMCLQGKSLYYSECDAHTDFSGVQALIIDFMGALAYLYRYAKWAYVGGGFTPYLHNIIEAVVYGIPVAFGPQIGRKAIPQEMVRLGIGEMVRSASELKHWFKKLHADSRRLAQIRETAFDYMNRNAGATRKVVDILMQLSHWA